VSALPEQVQESVRRHRLFRRGQSILVGVSGGLDSMVLLQLLNDASAESNWRLTVAHLNHRLRGQSSAADERLVRRTAERLGLSFVGERLDVRAHARTKGLSLEMAARELRHAFLARTARRLHIRTIALAHHADDQVELFFLRLVRGSGSEGLAGMKWRAWSPADMGIELVRPLLSHPKSELRQYAVEQGIRFREDASNALLDMSRNRIRHELVPLLKRRYQPRLDRVILRTMRILEAEAELVREEAGDWLARMQASVSSARLKRKTKSNLAVTPFDELPPAVQRRCLQLQLARKGIEPDFDLIERLRVDPGVKLNLKEGSSSKLPTRRTERRLQHAESPDRLAGANRGQRTRRNLTVHVVRDATGLIRIIKTEPAGFRAATVKLPLGRAPGALTFEGVQFRWRFLWRRLGAQPKSQPGREFFDAEKVGRRILLRHWQPGDRFQPIGMPPAVKLQDLLTNAKVPRERRRELVVAATDRGEIFWVEGLRMAERFKLTKDTICRFEWCWRRL